MDVIYPPKAPTGSDIFQSGGFGEVQIGKLGNQDEYVEIDSDDSDTVPQIESLLRNDASVTGVNAGAAGAGTGAKSMAGSSLAPREVAAVSSASSREQHTTKSRGSVGRSSRSTVVGRALLQSTPGADVSPRDSDGPAPKVFNEETSKRPIFKELLTQMSIKSNGVRKQSSVGLSKSLSKSGDRNEEDGVRSRERDAQAILKRKASDIEPSTSTAPAKRPKVHGNSSDSSDIPPKNSKADESQLRGLSLSTGKEDTPLNRKEKFDGSEDEGRERILKASEKRHRKLVLETDDDTQDEGQCTSNQRSDGKRKKSAGVKAASEVSSKKDSFPSGLARTGATCSGKQVFEKQQPPLAGENGVAPFRSAFPLHARRKARPPISGNNKSHAGTRYAAHSEDGKPTWVTCVKCKKLRKVNADVNLKRSTWCCEKNTRDPRYASCSAPQEQNDHWKSGEVPTDELEVPSEREARTGEKVTLNQTKDMVKDKDIARRNIVWVKLQVDGKELYWPGLQVRKFDPAIQKKNEESIEGFSGQTRVVRLFHPREGVDKLQVVKRSSVKPFQQARLSYKDSSSDPDFLAAVTAADKYYIEPDTSMEGFSQLASGSNEEPMPNATDEEAGCQVEDLPREEAESNELESEDVESQDDKERGTLEDEEVIQVPIEQGKAQNSSEARNPTATIGESADPRCVQSQADEGRVEIEDEDVLQISVELKDGAISPTAGDMIKSSNKRDGPQFSLSHSDKVEVIRKIETPNELGNDDVEVKERIKGSEASGSEELYGSGEKVLLDLEVLPTRRLILYDGTTQMLHFQDGFAVSIDPDSFGKELGKSSTGRTLHECIHQVGKRAIREKFPRSARSSNGLKFSALNPSDSFAKRLRDIWLREYEGELMPEFLKTRFVAGCIMEERGESVNWAHELSRTIRQELKEITSGLRKSLSPNVLNPIVQMLEKQVDQAPLPTFKAEEGEESMDIIEHDPYCQQCNNSGELLCCDGNGCRKTYHLKCLNPPLDEPPSGTFFCPGCLAEDLTRGTVHQLPSSNVNETAALEDSSVVEDLRVSRMVADATVSEDSQIGSTPRLVVDSLQTKKHALSDDRQEMPRVLEPSIIIDLGISNASPLGSRRNGLEELGGENMNVQVGVTCIPLTDNGAITEQQGEDSALELEEGEISPLEQANATDISANNSAPKLTDTSPPLITRNISSGVELPCEEEELPSSDDHNNICEGCDVGGELMYVTTPSLTSTPSSPLLLCDGEGCKVVYHKECLNPPLQTVPAGEWYCPGCEKGKVGKIWSVRKACSVVRSRADARSSDATGSGNLHGDQHNSEDEAQNDVPLGARFGSSSQHPEGAVNESGLVSGSCANVVNTNLKDGSVEYLVQWKSRSHAHDKWVNEKELEKLAPKELARFKKFLHEGQLYHAQEKYDAEWTEPERIIQKRLTRVTRRRPDSPVEKEKISNIQNAEIEWFVKWKGLGYEHCTWEPANAGVLASSRGIELINEFEGWKNAAMQRARKESQEEAEKRVKLPFNNLETQPDWMIRPELLPLQLEALNKLRRLWHARMNGILVYEASQEKIVMTIMFFLSLVEDYRVVRPILVVVPKSLIQNWEHELYLWAPKLYIVNYASKTEDARGIIRRTEFSSFCEPFKPQIVLTTFEVLNCDMDHLKKVEWEALIIDEGRSQRLQKSYQKSYRPCSQIKSTFRLLLLSEPLKSNVEELIQFVNFLEPRKSVFSHGDDMTQVTELRRRLTGRVLEYIPENRLTEYWVPVDMSPVQLEQYYNLLVRHYPTLSRNHRDHQIQDVVAKLRQSCNHPLLADPALNRASADLTPTEILDHDIEISGKMKLLHLIMPILKAANWRVLIFSQETKQLDILERYMTQSHGSDSFERVDSDSATKIKEGAIQRFNAEGSKRFVLLLKTGVHISFKNVQFLLLYDSDWNPSNDMRALHKIHNEGEASSKPLPVLRLYTHLTVEESTLILFRDKQLPPTRSNVSARICQKLLTWGASKIFDRYDSTNCPTGSSYRPKGAKFCPKAKLKQVVYNPEVVQKLLEALRCEEVGNKLEGDELLEAILVPRDEPASLFAESEHPINMVIGDSAEAFWAESLKSRHDDWQSKEVNMLGKGQRGKKRITYDEDAMATAVYTKAQLLEESERKRPRRRKASSEEEQEVVTDPSAQVIFPTDNHSVQVNIALHSNSPDPGQLQGNPDEMVSPQLEALGPAHGPVNHDHDSNRNAGSEVVRDPPKSNTEMFWECLPTICETLELPRPVIERVEALLKHFMQVPKNIRKSRATYEIIALELAVVWLAAKQLNYAIDKMMCISKVEEKLGTKFENRPQLVGPLYSRVVELCAGFESSPAPPAAVLTTPQPSLVPESCSPGASVQNHPHRADLEHSSRNASIQATEREQPACSLPENVCVVSQETDQPVVADVPSVVVPASTPLSVQGTTIIDDAPAVEESQISHTSDEPVVETDTEVVLVGADPRLVPDEPLDTIIDQSRFTVPDPNGTLVSDASMVEQGKGWVLINPAPDVLVEEQVPVLDATTSAFGSSSTVQSVGTFPSQGTSLQRDREAVSATLGAPIPEVPGIPISNLPVESTSSPSTQIQGSSLNQRSALRTIPPSRPGPSATAVSPSSTVQADGGSRVAQSLASANPAEDQLRQHVGRSPSPAIPVAISSQQQRGHAVQSGPQQRSHSVQPMTGEGISNSQRPATEVASTAAMQQTGLRTRGQLQRGNAPVHPGPTPNLQRGAAVASRSFSAPMLIPAVPPAVVHTARPSAPASVTPPAVNATGHVYPDVLLKEKEKLSKDMEKAKTAYESESLRIKSEYDREAEILHKKYEGLLVEQHRSFTKRQQQLQQNIVKVEWNRQLAEALRLREELAHRAAVFAGLSRANVQPLASQQGPQPQPLASQQGPQPQLLASQQGPQPQPLASQQGPQLQPLASQQGPQPIPGRPQLGGTAAAPVPGSMSWVTTNAANTGPGISDATMRPPGIFSTRVSTAPLQHPPRYGMHAALHTALQQDYSRYGMPAPQQQESPRNGMPVPQQQVSPRNGVPVPQQQESLRNGRPVPQQQVSPRNGMPVASWNDHPRSSMSEAMAVLAANVNGGLPGYHIGSGISRVRPESVFTPPLEHMNLDAGAGSPRPRTSGSSFPGVVAPVPPPPFQDPILSIISNSVPSLPPENPVVVSPVNPVAIPSIYPAVVPSMSPQQTSTGIPGGGMGSLLNPQSPRPGNPLPAGIEYQIPQNLEAVPAHQIDPRAHSSELHIIEGVEVLLNSGHISSETQGQPAANVGTQELPVSNVGTQEQPVVNAGTREQAVVNDAASSRPPNLIYLSDSDED